ncbi:cyclin-K-like, partial [Mizuhopecten yessoensis]|uniref:cyclin-K-like n=1 Tax=Mizuhopecten yessoensis TaxID=6573 RepID=UPI000B45F6B2
MNTVSSAFTGGQSSMAPPGQPAGGVEEVYAGAYEEPWDSKQSLQHFSKIVGKAESKYPESTDDRIIPGVVIRPKVKQPEVAVYEDAWDTEEKQKQFENKVKEAQRKQSGVVSQKSESEASTATYDEPWTDINSMRTTHPPKSSPGQPKKKVSPSSSPSHRPPQSLPPLNNPAHRPLQNLPGSSRASVPSEFESNTYESPWDTKKREQELEDKVQKLRHGSPVNQRTVVDTPPPLSPGSPPNFFPPPPPSTQMYEEAWDMKRPSHLLAKSQPEGQRFSPAQKRMSEGSGRDRAEPIDSGLPLDIQ